jgi:hypothetical protein
MLAYLEDGQLSLAFLQSCRRSVDALLLQLMNSWVKVLILQSGGKKKHV